MFILCNLELFKNLLKMMATPNRIFLALLIYLSWSAADSFSWDSFDGPSYVPEVHNQNLPNPCNAGWVYSAVDVLNSRMKINQKSPSLDHEISAKTMLNCYGLEKGCQWVLGGLFRETPARPLNGSKTTTSRRPLARAPRDAPRTTAASTARMGSAKIMAIRYSPLTTPEI
jgi:hypothetical protein